MLTVIADISEESNLSVLLCIFVVVIGDGGFFVCSFFSVCLVWFEVFLIT